MLLKKLLDRAGGPPIRVALAQDRIDGRAEHHREPGLQRPLGVVLGFLRIVGDSVALGLEFLDGVLELGHGRADVRQFEDGRLGRLGHVAELAQTIGNALLGA